KLVPSSPPMPRAAQFTAASEGNEDGPRLLPGDAELAHEIAARDAPTFAGDSQCHLPPQQVSVAIVSSARSGNNSIGADRFGRVFAVRQIEIKVLRSHPSTTLVDHGFLEHHLEFSHITGPMVILKALERLGCHTSHRQSLALVESSPEVLDQQRDVLTTL